MKLFSKIDPSIEFSIEGDKDNYTISIIKNGTSRIFKKTITQDDISEIFWRGSKATSKKIQINPNKIDEIYLENVLIRDTIKGPIFNNDANNAKIGQYEISRSNGEDGKVEIIQKKDYTSQDGENLSTKNRIYSDKSKKIYQRTVNGIRTFDICLENNVISITNYTKNNEVLGVCKYDANTGLPINGSPVLNNLKRINVFSLNREYFFEELTNLDLFQKKGLTQEEFENIDSSYEQEYIPNKMVDKLVNESKKYEEKFLNNTTRQTQDNGENEIEI